MVPYARLHTHFSMEKSHFPHIPESGEPSLDEGIVAFPPPEPRLLPGPQSAASRPWALRSILFCCFFTRSPWDYLYLLFSIMKIVSLAWGKHKVEMLKIYCSGLLLKRDFAVRGRPYCAMLVSPPCPGFCNVGVLAKSFAICAGPLCLLGFCLKPSKTITNFPKHSLRLRLWFTFPPFSS